jgi:hypothetical protein
LLKIFTISKISSYAKILHFEKSYQILQKRSIFRKKITTSLFSYFAFFHSHIHPASSTFLLVTSNLRASQLLFIFAFGMSAKLMLKALELLFLCIEQTDCHCNISGFLTNSTLADAKYGMAQMEQTKWNFFMFTYDSAPTTVDFCAAWCRLHYESTTYPKCNVFVFDGSTCYIGDITKTAAYNVGPAGKSDVYYDIGRCSFMS